MQKNLKNRRKFMQAHITYEVTHVFPNARLSAPRTLLQKLQAT